MTTGEYGLTEVSSPDGFVKTPDDPRLKEIVETLAAAGGESVATILLYGSHVQASSPDRWSAYDFLLITDSYGPFFRRLSELELHSRPAWVLTALSHFLPPNIISFGMERDDRPPAKCAVVSLTHLRRALRPHSPDHFLKGRAVQKLAQVWSRGPRDQEAVVSAIKEAREGIVHWVRPFLPGPFSVESFAETMLRVSYRGEIRPESPKRVGQVFEAQKENLTGMARKALHAAAERGMVTEGPDGFRWARRPGRGSRIMYTLYFAGSKTRATARWFKYIVTFDGWLDYVVRKIERRAGFTVEIKERERRWPLIFLWPKLFSVLRALKNANPPPQSEVEGESV